jgi:bifunctional DNase/RNase
MEGLIRKVEHDFGINIKTWVVVKHIKKSSFVARIVTQDGKKKLSKAFISRQDGSFLSPNRSKCLPEEA